MGERLFSPQSESHAGQTVFRQTDRLARLLYDTYHDARITVDRSPVPLVPVITHPHPEEKTTENLFVYAPGSVPASEVVYSYNRTPANGKNAEVVQQIRCRLDPQAQQGIVWVRPDNAIIPFPAASKQSKAYLEKYHWFLTQALDTTLRYQARQRGISPTLLFDMPFPRGKKAETLLSIGQLRQIRDFVQSELLLEGVSVPEIPDTDIEPWRVESLVTIFAKYFSF